MANSVITVAPEHLETTGCGLCGSSDSSIRFEIRGFPIRTCTKCGMQYVSPRLQSSNLIDMYSDESYYRSDNSLVHGYGDYLADRENIIRTFKRRLEWILNATQKHDPGRLLDVGCAAGFAVEYAIQQGWNASGLEPSRFAAETARQRLGDKVIQGTLDQTSYPAASFDMVLLWDVIEHVPDPVATLKQVHRLLPPGGILSLITPDAGSVMARLMGRHWMEYAKPTEHIYFFAHQTMQKALTLAGFEVLARSTAGKYIGLDFFVDRVGAHVPFMRFLRNKNLQGALERLKFYINPGDKLHWVARKVSV